MSPLLSVSAGQHSEAGRKPINEDACGIRIPDDTLLETKGVAAVIADGVSSCAAGREASESCVQAARAIVTNALERGSHDNVTCQVLKVDGLPFHENEEAFYRHLTELPFPTPLEPGMVLDDFRILRELHASKRTQIYLALDTETNRRTVLKTPSVSYADDARYIDRFLHEEWAGRRISNAHVLALEAPRRRRRFLYYATEYVEGRDLRQYEMLTGQLPYGDDLTGWQRRRPPYTPAKRYNPEVPAWMDGALRKAVQVNPMNRYGHLSEFIHDLSHPNPECLEQPLEPLLERNPVGFWRGAAMLLFVPCLLELYLLTG